MRNHIFFQLLHQARRLRNELHFPYLARQAYLIGMIQVHHLQAEEDRAKQNSLADPGCYDAYQDRIEE